MEKFQNGAIKEQEHLIGKIFGCLYNCLYKRRTKMKKNEVKNDQDQQKITFDDFDELRLKSFAENTLIRSIEKGISSSIEDTGVKTGYSISLNAEFGNGKTTFLRMFEHFIKKEKNNYDVLFINAWESDFYGEPTIVILSEFVNFLEQTQANKQTAKELIQIISKVASDEGKQLLYKTIQLAILTKGGINVNFKNIESRFKKYSDKFGKYLISDFNKRKECIKQIKNVISKYTKENNKKLLIIIDELDRARPDYAVHFLETMKHFFDIENVAFLVAVNRKQIEITVKRLYGQEMDFDRYYGKFFKQEVNLPNPHKDKEIRNFINSLMQKTQINIDNEGKLPPDMRNPMESYYLLCGIFKLTLREIKTFSRIFELILGSDKTNLSLVYQICYSFFICLFMKEEESFQKILDDKYSSGVTDYIRNKYALVQYPHDPANESSNVNTQIRCLLAVVECSFIPIQRDNLGQMDISEGDRKRITEIYKSFTLRYIIEQIFSPSRGLNANAGEQPVRKICETIQKYQSAFNE